RSSTPSGTSWGGDKGIGRGGRGILAVVPAAVQNAAPLAVGELRKVVAGDAAEVQPEVGGEGGDVPQHVPELLRQRLALRIGQGVARAEPLVAHQLAEFLGDLARLTGELERGVEHARVFGVERGGAGLALVLVEGHGVMLAGDAGRDAGVAWREYGVASAS